MRIKLKYFQNFKLYFDNSPFCYMNNIELYSYPNKDFLNKIKEKFLQIYLFFSDTMIQVIENSSAITIVDEKENKYYIFIREEQKQDPFSVFTLFHELSHIYTLPEKSIELFETYDTEKISLLGYSFWREYAANYFAYRSFLLGYSDLLCLESIDGFISYIEKKINSSQNMLLEDLIALINISPYKLKKEYFKKEYQKKIKSILALAELALTFSLDPEQPKKINPKETYQFGIFIQEINN